MSTHRDPVLVGVDGTPTSIAAAAWGYDEARSRGVPLHLVNAYPGEASRVPRSSWDTLLPSEAGALGEISARLLADAVTRLANGNRPPDHDVEIDTYSVDGDPRTVLLERARRAVTVAIGSRRHSALHSAVLGSLGTALTTAATCPVVVHRWSADLSVTRPEVVVGVQSDENCEDAIAFAFDYASRHRLPLQAVLCRRLPLLMPASRAERDVSAGARVEVSEAVAGWREKYPDVTVREDVVLEHPIEGLLYAARGQRLLVVGRRTHRSVPGLVLGSVSQGVLHHASCPVAVVG